MRRTVSPSSGWMASKQRLGDELLRADSRAGARATGFRNGSARRVHDHDHVGGVVDQGPEVLLALAQRVDRAPPVRHVDQRPLDDRLRRPALFDPARALDHPDRCRRRGAAGSTSESVAGPRLRQARGNASRTDGSEWNSRRLRPRASSREAKPSSRAKAALQSRIRPSRRRAIDAGEAALEVMPESRLGGPARLLDLAQAGDVGGDPGRPEQVAAGVADGRRLERERDEAFRPCAGGGSRAGRSARPRGFARAPAGPAPRPLRGHPVGHRPADHLLRSAAVDPAGRAVDERPAAERVRRPDQLVRVLDEVAVALFARADGRAGFSVFDENIMSRRERSNKPRRHELSAPRETPPERETRRRSRRPNGARRSASKGPCPLPRR